MVEKLYCEYEGKVFESCCGKKEICARCYRLFKRNFEKQIVDLTKPPKSPPKCQIIEIE